MGHNGKAPPMESPEDLLTPMEVAARLRISRTVTYELIAAGILPAIRLSDKLIRVRRGDLAQWIASRSAAAVPA